MSMSLQEAEYEGFLARMAEAIEFAGGATAVAKKTGLSRRTIHSYRTGETDPSRERLLALAGGMGVNSHWLLTGQGDMEADVTEETKGEAEPPSLDFNLPPRVQGAIAKMGPLPPTQLGIVAELMMNIQMNPEYEETQKDQAKAQEKVAAAMGFKGPGPSKVPGRKPKKKPSATKKAVKQLSGYASQA